MSKKLINVRKVFEDKNPTLLKILPGFVLNYLKRILHEEEINQIIADNEGVNGAEFCHSVLNYFNIKVTIKGVENIPHEGGVILVGNHPLGGMDALAVVDQLTQQRGDIRFIVNDILLNLENLKGLFVGVNKHGKNALKSLQEVDRLFASEKALFVFPAGLVSRKSKGKIEDLDWKKTFVTRARKYNKPIVPVHIDGRLSNFFYRFANLRVALCIKANLEMLYLADEQFRLRNQTINITVGKPVPSDELHQGGRDHEWAKKLKKMVYSLKE